MTTVITFSFMPAGINMKGNYQTSLNLPANAKHAIRKGIRRWEDHTDTVWMEAIDNGGPDQWPSGHSMRHVRIGMAPEVPSNSGATAFRVWFGLDETVAFNTTPNTSLPLLIASGAYSGVHYDWVDRTSMHEVGHNCMNLHHDNSVPNVMKQADTSKAVLGYQTTAIRGMYGAPKASLSALYSDEFGLLVNLYRGLLGVINPSTNYAYGFKGLLQLRPANTWETLSQGLINTSEHTATGMPSGSNTNFVNTVFLYAVGRFATSTETSYYMNLFTLGYSRAQVAVEICARADAKSRTIALYPYKFWH